MSTPVEFYSDRVSGPAPRTHDVLPETTAKGLVSLVRAKAIANWFAHAFPEPCQDSRGVVGTDITALGANVQALVPGVDWPLWRNDALSDEQVFDLVEYSATRVVRPELGAHHSFFGHHELLFTAKDAPALFRGEVNQILARGGTTFELTQSGAIQRTGTIAVRQVLTDLRPNTGDAELDELVEESRVLYLSRSLDQRRLGLERLWDAFERLKTIDLPGRGKKQSVQALLDHVVSPGLRSLVETEMTTLTNIGNNFNIRHRETQTLQVPVEAEDYLYARMGSLIILLLHQSGRLQ